MLPERRGRRRSTLGNGQQSEPLHAIVLLPEIAHQHAKGLIDVERPDRNHLLKISPVLRPVEEGFEDGQIGTTKKWNLPATKLMELATLCRLKVEFGRVDRKSTRLNSSHLGISYAVF